MPTSADVLAHAYDLSPGAVEAFDRQGFVRLRQVMPPETLEAYEPEITRNVIELNTMHLPMADRSTYNKAFLQVVNLWERSAVVRELVFAKRLARVAAELMGVDGVRIYHDQALYKEPGGGITPWHADQYYWPFESDRTCTVWIPLQTTPLEMGPLAFSAGSHRFEFGRGLGISDESEAAMQKALAEQNFPHDEEPYGLGDVSYHQGWTFHRAAPNTTQTPRRVMTIIYMDAGIVVSEPVNDAQRADLAEHLPGAEPGQVPDTSLTPVLFRRS